MIINQEILNKILKEQRNPNLKKAEEHESRLSLHGFETDTAPIAKAFEEFLEIYPKNLLPAEKASTFESLITYPLPTVSLVKEVYKELWKVFDAQNKVETFVFNNNELIQDFQEYRASIKEPGYWASIGWGIIQTKINSILVVDLSAEQETELPEPLFFTVPVEQVRALEQKRDGETLEYFIWQVDLTDEEKNTLSEKVYIYDDAAYQIATKAVNSEEFVIVLNNPHDLGYCPARHYWTDNRTEMQKAAPHGKELGNLDWILYQTISGRNLELYAGFPIITTYQEDCTYETEDGYACDKGYTKIPRTDDNTKYDRKPCPDCESRTLVGPGSVKEVPAPRENVDADLMPAVEVTKGDVASLEWFESSLKNKIDEFKMKVVGQGGEPKNDQAKNQKQIDSGFESKQTILSDVARNLEKIQKFTLDTIARLRYGEKYEYSIISYGNKFFLQTEKETLENYKQAKDEGLPNYVLEDMRINMLQKRYRNDPDMLNRIMLLDLLEPLPDYDVKALVPIVTIDPKVTFMKINFNDLIKRFELENGNILEYREGIEMNARVAKIKEILDKYVDETFIEPPEPEPETIPGGGPPKPGAPKPKPPATK